MKRTLTLLGCFGFLFLFAAGCQEQTPKPSPVLFRVDGRAVTLQQFQNAFSRTLPVGRQLTPEEHAELQRSFLVQAIDRELTLAEADRLGLKVTPLEIEAAFAEAKRDYVEGEFEKMLLERGLSLEDWRGDLSSSLLMEKVVQQAAYSRAAVSDAEVAAYYQQHPEEYEQEDQVRARQIVVSSAEEGQHVLDLLRQGKDFAEVAREYSLSPDSEAGGDLGFFPRGEMPAEFDEVVFDLPVGRLSNLVQSPYGYHIFRVEEHRNAKSLTLQEAAPAIREKLSRHAEERAYQHWLQELRSKANIEIDMDLLATGEKKDKP